MAQTLPCHLSPPPTAETFFDRRPRDLITAMTPYLRACHPLRRRVVPAPGPLLWTRPLSSMLESLVNWEQLGIPPGAGTTSSNAFDLGRMHRLLYKLGDPHMQLKAVHVAGSKGKGSTSVLVTEMLRAAGHKVGLYTSPHMHHVSERISTSPLAPLSPGDLELLVKDYSPLLAEQQQQEQGALSHFEALTALAFRHFVDEQVDVAVIETGMGGLTDATNVIPASRLQLAVITALGFEHAAALGGTLQSIAAAKAGIMKAGRPVVVSAQQHPEALQVVLQHAASSGCEALQADQLVKVEHSSFQAAAEPAGRSAIHEVLQVSSAAPPGATPLSVSCAASLVGRHQHANIAAAVTAALKLRDMGWAIGEEHIKAGIQQAHLPGRFQVLALSPPGSNRHVVLDGAHSAESAAALVSTLQHVFPGQPVVLVLAMAADKEHRAVIDQLRACSPRAVIFTEVPIAGSQARSCSPGVLAGQWQVAVMTSPGGSRCRQLIQASLPAAIDKAKHELSAFNGPGVICITGSLHAAAQALTSLTEH